MKLERFDNTLLIVGNLGELEAYAMKYELDIDPKDSAHTSHKHHRGELVEHLSFTLIDDEALIAAHKKISEIVTDQQGHYEGIFGGESGEDHNLETEIITRLLKLIAEEINRLVKTTNPKEWYLAFPEAYNKELFSLLEEGVKSKLKTNIKENLVKVSPQKVIERL